MVEYIDREALIQNIDEGFDKTDPCGEEQIGFLKCRRIAREIPAADVAQVLHGRWVASGQCNHKPYRMRSADHWTTYKCSECGFSNGRRYNDNFCPNCGAKMDLEG